VKDEFGFIRDYKEYTPGIHVNKYEDLLNLLRNKVDCVVDKREWVVEQFWGDYRNKNNEALYDRIHNK
jgi:hypothetical protein